MGGGRPTRSQVTSWAPETWQSVGERISTFASGLRTQSGNQVSAAQAVEGPDGWQGEGQKGAESRSSTDRDEVSKVADRLEDASDALENGGKFIEQNRTKILDLASALEEDDFEVSDDWTVTDVSSMANEDDLSAARASALKARRERAENEQVTLRSLADTLGEDDQKYGKKVSQAFEGLDGILSSSASLSSTQADKDLAALRGGYATPEQKQRLIDATTLTDEQQQALAEGKDAVIPKGQMDYLNELVGDVDKAGGLDAFTQFGGSDDRSKQAMGDALQILSNPNVRTDQFDTSGPTTPLPPGITVDGDKKYVSGGMDALPDSISEPLTSTDTGYHEEIMGTSFIRYWDVSQVDKLEKISNVVGKGSPHLRTGTDIDRGLLARSSEVAEALQDNRGKLDSPLLLNGTGDDAKPMDFDETTDRLDGIVEVAGSDHVAVHDAMMTGREGGPEPVGTMPGEYDANKGITNLMTVDWDEEKHHGVENMLSWMGDEDVASYNPETDSKADFHQATLAGESASEMGEIITSESNFNTLMNNAVHDNHTIGDYNPGITQATADGISPHLGGMVGADTTLLGTEGSGPLSGPEDAKQLFAVLDTDPSAAQTVNTRAYEQVEALQASIGHGVDADDAGTSAGRMSTAMDGGLDVAVDELNNDERNDVAESYKNDGIAYDASKTLVNSFLPAPASTAIDIANEPLKEAAIGPEPDAHEVENSDATAAEEESSPKITGTMAGSQQSYINMLEARAADDPDFARNSTAAGYFGDDGHVDFDKIREKSGSFKGDAREALGETNRLYDEGWEDERDPAENDVWR